MDLLPAIKSAGPLSSRPQQGSTSTIAVLIEVDVEPCCGRLESGPALLIAGRRSIGLAPDSVGTCQDSNRGGRRHFLPPRLNRNNSSCQGALGFLGAMSCLIRQPLANEATQRLVDALFVIEAQL